MMARRGTDKVRFPGSVFFSDDGVKEHHFQEVREQFNNGSLDPCRWLRGLDCGGTFGRGQLKKTREANITIQPGELHEDLSYLNGKDGQSIQLFYKLKQRIFGESWYSA